MVLLMALPPQLFTYSKGDFECRSTLYFNYYYTMGSQSFGVIQINYENGQLYVEDGAEVITWEQCTLRAWLNGDFCNEAFTEEEKAAILVSDLLCGSISLLWVKTEYHHI